MSLIDKSAALCRADVRHRGGRRLVVKRWRDKQVFGWMLILGFAVFEAWTLWHTSDLSFFKVSALAGAFSMLVLYALPGTDAGRPQAGT
ncbi:hypothetical protein [Streptomyces sp. NPDC010273]|uniref:hypothetical protein n=1 Tax=Streptomyces sp. NPDC010273 TaxID=3364829 RepID=UPI0036EAAAEE